MQIAAWKFGCHNSPHSKHEGHGESRIPKGVFDEKVKNLAVARPSFSYLLLALALALCGLSCGVCERPFISSISPSSITAGGSQFLLMVNGSDFRRDSVVSWNGSFRVTSFFSHHQLAAAITAADIAQPGSVLVFVFNPSDGNTTSVSGAIGDGLVTGCAAKSSNAVAFTINP